MAPLSPRVFSWMGSPDGPAQRRVGRFVRALRQSRHDDGDLHEMLDPPEPGLLAQHACPFWLHSSFWQRSHWPALHLMQRRPLQQMPTFGGGTLFVQLYPFGLPLLLPLDPLAPLLPSKTLPESRPALPLLLPLLPLLPLLAASS